MTSLVKNGSKVLKDGGHIQIYRCKSCHKRSNERTGTPMAKLRTSAQVVAYALKMRSEGGGVRATGRVFGKSHATISNWENRVAQQASAWSPPAPPEGDVTIEGDELYTRVGENP